jgi:RNA polymerase sigma-70 factor, ECF subfamily
LSPPSAPKAVGAKPANGPPPASGPPDPPDATWVARALAGDERAFAHLLDRYRSRVYGLAVRMVQSRDDAADIAQEAFVRAFQALATFDPTKSFGAWIARITANLCIDHYRRRRAVFVPLDAEPDTERGERKRDLPDQAPLADERVARSESAAQIAELVEALPPRYRMVVVLRYQEDLAYEEIADILRLPLGTVKARLHRAHHLLKRRLDPKGVRGR